MDQPSFPASFLTGRSFRKWDVGLGSPDGAGREEEKSRTRARPRPGGRMLMEGSWAARGQMRA